MKTVQLTPEFVRRFNEQERILEELRRSVTAKTPDDNGDLRRENTRLAAEVERLKSASASDNEANTARERHRAEIAKLTAILDDLKTKSRTLEITAEKQKVRLAEKESHLLKVQHELDSSREEVQTLQANREEMQKQLSKLQQNKPAMGNKAGKSADDSDEVLFLRSEIEEKDKLIECLAKDKALLEMTVSSLKARRH